MSQDATGRPSLEPSNETYPPLSSAREIAPGNRPRAWFDDGLRFAIKEEGRLRAPNQESVWRHQTGFAGELAVSGYFREPANREIYPSYEGDDGYDIEVHLCGEKWRVETKTVSNGDLELAVNRNRVDQADYFVLCRTDDPRMMVEIVGWINRQKLQQVGETYPGDTKIRVEPRYLSTLEPLHISPDRIRDAQVRNLTLD